jgi:hypothetical protein
MSFHIHRELYRIALPPCYTLGMFQNGEVMEASTDGAVLASCGAVTTDVELTSPRPKPIAALVSIGEEYPDSIFCPPSKTSSALLLLHPRMKSLSEQQTIRVSLLINEPMDDQHSD